MLKKSKIKEFEPNLYLNTGFQTFQFPNPTTTAVQQPNWTFSGYEHITISDLVYKINEIIRELNKR